jgi:hypothetical protein
MNDAGALQRARELNQLVYYVWADDGSVIRQ